MQKFHRGTRRHHRERLIRKFFKQHTGTYWYYNRHDSEEYGKHIEWAVRYARTRVKCRSVHDCWCCCNPRNRYGNSKVALTRQELRFIEGVKVDSKTEE